MCTVPKSYEWERQRESERKNNQTRKKTDSFRKRGRDARPRQRDWWEDLDEEGTLADESIMPRDESDRRAATARLGFQKNTPPPSEMLGLMGRVLSLSANLCQVEVEGETALYTLRGSLSLAETGYTHPVAVGDWVQVEVGARTVLRVMPRRNILARPDPYYTHLQHAIAANVDQVLIVAAWQLPTLWVAMIDRYLIAAERAGIRPLICLNKADLAADRAAIESYQSTYRALGYDCLLTSIITGEGIENLAGALRGQTSVLSGLSGVGKSSLLQAIEPRFQLRVGEVSSWGEDGRHTTTAAQMLPFAGGYVIDTPGVRAFHLGDLTRAELLAYYPDLVPHAQDCAFRDCRHQAEPVCGIRAAAEGGAIPAWRYKSYLDVAEALPG
jgi:ribosome biogenesis GTPase